MTEQENANAAGQLLNPQQLQYILNGATILGSGGGGPYSAGQAIIKQIGNQPVNLIPPTSVSLSSWTAVSAFVGSPTAAANQPPNFGVATAAFKAMQQQVGKTFACVLPGEVGAGNTFIPMLVAVQMGIPVVDAAGACRAIPGFLMSTYAAKKLPAAPFVLTDGSAGVGVNCDNSIADPVTRGIISGGAFAQDAGIAFWAMTGRSMIDAAVPGMTTQALNIGQALANAISRGEDPVAAVRTQLAKPNYLLGVGNIISASETTSGGFDFGTVVLKTTDGSGQTITIYNQNENLIAFSNEAPVPIAMGPDLICYITKTGQVFSNADITPAIMAQEVALIGVPAYQMRNQFIIDQFLKALAGIGYAGSYIPLGQLEEKPKAA